MKKIISFIFFSYLFLCLFKTVVADSNDVNLINLATTTHSYVNTFNEADQGVVGGPLTFDGDFSTSLGNSGGAQGNTSIVSSQHTFIRPVDIRSIQYKMTAGGHCGGNYGKSADYEVYVQYRTGGTWHYLPDSQSSGSVGDGSINSDGRVVTYSVPINNVTDILAYARGQGHGEDRASNGSYAYIFEIQAWGKNYVDVGLRAYDGANIIKIACEPVESLASPLRIRKGNVTYGIALVDPADASASKFRIKTSSGIKALAKIN